MGEKGNALQGATAIGGLTDRAVGGATVFEKVTTSATEAVVGLGQDLAGTIKDKSIGAVADNTVIAARERLHRKSSGSQHDGTAAADDKPTPPTA